jgi:DNA recombination protein RmuC
MQSLANYAAEQPLQILMVATLLAAVALGVLAAFWLSRSRGDSNTTRIYGELTGRLTQMAENQSAYQSRMAEQLQTQERLLAKELQERLGDFSKKMGDSLQESSSRSHSALTDLRERLAVIDKAQQNITALSAQVVGLQDILANKQARGAFGEIQLRDIVEPILPPSAYEFQVTLGNGRRVDCLLQLPNPPGPIAIDAKFPLESFQAIRNAENDAAEALARRNFGNDLRKHIQDIAARYILLGETAESALMFLPSEAVYAELHANFRDVVEESYRARVWIVSPTTLMATLNTVRAVLKDVRMREQAGIIQAEVWNMMQDVARLDKRVGNLEGHFNLARRDIDEIRTSANKIVRRGERIGELEFDEKPAVVAEIEPKRRTAAGN